MSEGILLKKVWVDCPICDSMHEIEMRRRISNGLLKGEIVEFEEIFYLCTLTDEEDNEYVPAGLMDDNLKRARIAYNNNRCK